LANKRIGEKETIIFIHGLVGNDRAFKKEKIALSPHYRVISYNLLGHGDDKGTETPFRLDDLIHQLEEIYRIHRVEKAHLCTLSYGCYIGTIFASLFPQKVTSLCCIGGHYNNPSALFSVFEEFWNRRDEPYSRWLNAYTSKIFPLWSQGFDPSCFISKKVYYRLGLTMHPTVIVESLRHRIHFDLKARLKQLTHPVLWVMGGFDHLYKSCLYDLQTLVPHVIYREIPFAGHAAHLFRPDVFRSIYLRFLLNQKEAA